MQDLGAPDDLHQARMAMANPSEVMASTAALAPRWRSRRYIRLSSAIAVSAPAIAPKGSAISRG